MQTLNNTVTLKLILNREGEIIVEDTVVKPGDHIDWEINDNAISSFRIVSKTKNVKPPFEMDGKLDKAYRKFYRYRIAKDSKATEWEYCVEWRDSDGIENVKDPKITVEP